jgi:ABC-type glycerol-3-phosphate transport system substrate-binding protein
MSQTSSTFQVSLLVIFGSLAVAGILIFALFVGGGNKNSIGALTIWGTLDGTAVNSVIGAAADSNPNLSQIAYVQKDPATFESDLTSALAAGKGPDIFILQQNRAVEDSEKIVQTPYTQITRSQFESTFIAAATPYLTETGILAFPFAADPLVLYWNRDMLAAGGYARPPQYWDELYAMAQNMTRRDESGNIKKSAIAMGEYQNISNAKDILSALIMQAGNDIMAYDASGKLSSVLSQKTGGVSQSTVSALNFYTEFANPSKSDYSWNRSLPDSRTAFAAGDVALYVGYASEVKAIQQTNPNLNFAVALLPQVRNASRSVDTGHVYAFAVPKTSANPQAALTAATLLSSASVSTELAKALSISSARVDALTTQVQGNADILQKSTIIMRAWPDPNSVKTEAIFRSMIEDTTSGAALPQETVQRADQQLSSAVEN